MRSNDFAWVLSGVLLNAVATGACVHARTDGDGMLVIPNRDIVLESDIHAFDVFPNRDKVDILVPATRHEGQRRANIGIKMKLLAQPHV